MSFGAGLGAGMGVGIGSGIAIGTASGKKRAVEKIREHLISRELTIHDSVGKEVDIDTVLNEAVAENQCASSGRLKVTLIFALLAGVATLGVIFYFVLQ